uniref:PWWP domain-containing protein n=1 Tax=Anopheles farauti TaxID=69004 RepID=A0A182QGK9_9DIPT
MSNLCRSLSRFRLITFDVTDTLLEYAVRPERHYAQVINSVLEPRIGLTLHEGAIANAFGRCFRTMRQQYPNFGRGHSQPGEQSWHWWWRTLVEQVIVDAAAASSKRHDLPTPLLSAIAEQLIDDYTYDSRQVCWRQRPGVEAFLRQVRHQQNNARTVGIVSNFDPRLDIILRNNGIAGDGAVVDFVLTSYEAGVEKPDPAIFAQALERANELRTGGPAIEPHEALHVGNLCREDYNGARGAGWSSLLVNAPQTEKNRTALASVPCEHVYAGLPELQQRLETDSRIAQRAGNVGGRVGRDKQAGPMAAARPDNGSKQDDTISQPMQRPKPAPQPTPSTQSPSRYPTIFLNARKQVAGVPVPVPTRQHVARRLAPAQPPAPVPGMVTPATTTSTGPVLISAESVRRTVYATLPAMSFPTAGGTNGPPNTIVSSAKSAIANPPQSLTTSVPTTPSTLYKLVNAGTPRKRMPLLAPKPTVRNGEQKPITVTPPSIGRPLTAPYNNAPGWRRILRNKVIVYISPSKTELHSYEQAKEYLLTAGTCKCGLPCPFNPERFFQFDAQVPNVTMAPSAHGSGAQCAHLKRAKRLHPETTPPVAQLRPAPSAILLKTPPWRKNVPTAGPDRASPEQHKKPTFKDDPTGYLNQQTAILHSSISFLHSPDRRSPLPVVAGPGSPAAPETSPRRPLRPAFAQREAPTIKPSPIVKYEPKPVVVAGQASSGKAPTRMAYYVKANAPVEQQGTAAKVAKLNIAAPITTLTTTTTTTIARTHPIASAPLAPTSRASPHVISTVGGAQIVVIDGLQHTAGGSRIGGFPAAGLRPPAPPPTLPKPTTVVNYSLAARAPNGTTGTTTSTTPTSSAMILNGTNIIHLTPNGLSPAGGFGGLLQTHPDPSAAPKTSLSLPTNGTLVLNPAGTSIRFATDGTNSFVKPNATGAATTTTTYHYAPLTDASGSAMRKMKRLQPAPAPQPQTVTATFQQQPQPQPQPQHQQQQQPLQPSAGPFVQIASPYAGLQNIQLAPAGLSGLTVVPVSKAPMPQPQQQQQQQPQPQQPQPSPYNLLSQAQTILLPAGSMVMTSDATSATTTLLQIQNMAACQPAAASPTLALTGQTGLMLRQPPKPPPPGSFLAATTQTQPYLIGAPGTTHHHPRLAPHRQLAPATTPTPAAGTIFTVQQPHQPAPTAELDVAKRVATGGTVLLQPEVPTVLRTQPALSPNVPAPEPDGSGMCGSETEPGSGGMTITLKGPLLHAAKQPNTAKQAGAPTSEPTVGSTRTGRVLTSKLAAPRPATSSIAVRRTVTVSAASPANKQLPGPEERRKLSLAASPHHPEVLPEQSCDVIGSSSALSLGSARDDECEAKPATGCPFGVGDLVWGAVRGFPAWPGKVLRDGDAGALDQQQQQVEQQEPQQPARNSVWVRWFGTGRTHAERVDVATLRSLSEGLEMHHRAQKDARKSRKLNAQLEQAIQQAMQELDHASTGSGSGSGGYGRHGHQTTNTAGTVGGGQHRCGRYRRRRHPRRPPPGKHHAVVRTGTGSTSGQLRTRRTGNVRYLRGSKLKAKS